MVSDTGVIPPPIVILKSHDAKLEEHDNVIQEMIQQLDYLLDSVSTKGGLPAIKEASVAPDADNDADEPEPEPEQELLMEVVMNDLTNSREFVEGIVDKIVNDTNLSEVIMKIEPLVKENQELRSLIHSQQQMMNEMNTMLMRLLNKNASSSTPSHTSEPEESSQVVFQDDGLDNDGLYQPEMTEMTEIVLSTGPVELISEVSNNNDEDTEPAQIIDLEEADAPADADADADPDAPAEALDSTEETEPDTYSEMPHFPEQIALIVNEI
jgi:hypothetical protein